MSVTEVRLLDITDEDVEIVIAQSLGKTRLWVNINGVCMLRAYCIPTFKIEDNRIKRKK